MGPKAATNWLHVISPQRPNRRSIEIEVLPAGRSSFPPLLLRRLIEPRHEPIDAGTLALERRRLLGLLLLLVLLALERQRRKAVKDGRNTSHLKAYFDELHIAKGNKLSTMSRERDTYCTVMNFAADPQRTWAPADYPAPELPDYDPFSVPVNKWLHDEEVRLFIKLAPKHLKIMVAGVFATRIRGGEFLFISRRAPIYADRNATGLSLDPGTEHFYLGWSKSRKPIFRTIPDWYVEMLHVHLAGRRDRHDALVLNDEGRPYKRPRHQKGFLVRTAWKSMRERVAAARCDHPQG